MQAFTFVAAMMALCITVGDGANSMTCSEMLESKFHFGAPFYPQIEKLLNLGFSQNCTTFVAYLTQELSAWIEMDKWNELEQATRRLRANQLMPLLHQRALKSSRMGNLSKEMDDIESLLRAKPFGHESMFDIPDDYDSPCAERVQRFYNMTKSQYGPHSKLLSEMMNRFTSSECSLFLAKTKATVDQLVKLGPSVWERLSTAGKVRLSMPWFSMLLKQALKDLDGPESDNLWLRLMSIMVTTPAV